VGQAVHEAVRSLMEERGPGGFTGREVAERAGVNEATIYRRWGSLDNLLLDVAVNVERLNENSPMPDTGSLRGDLNAWAMSIAEEVARPDGLELLRAVLAARAATDARGDRAPRILALLEARADSIGGVLARAEARGESPPDLFTVLDRLIAPLYLREAFGYGEMAQPLDVLVDNTIAGTPRIHTDTDADTENG
jgi:AcrR family transcriptional regulator